MSAARSGIAIVLLAAVAENGVIGRDNALPWRLSTDLKRFKALTLGKPVVMGRKTYLSIGKPLPDRSNIVVTRDRNFRAKGVFVANSVEAALDMARDEAAPPWCERDHGDRRHRDIRADHGPCRSAGDYPRSCEARGDVHFPAIDPTLWRETARIEQPAGPRDDASVSFVTYERI